MDVVERASVIKTLHNVATTIQSEETVEGVCEQTVLAAKDLLAFNLCTVLIREGEWLVPYATSAEKLSHESHRMRIDEGFGGKTYQTQQSYNVAEITSEDETNPANESYRSGISVPVGDHGVFQAVRTVPDAFSEEDIELAELLVSHTTTALDNLRHEQELRQQNERLDHFASVVSHELRTPLTVAVGQMELLADECSNPQIDAIIDAHDRMDRLINDLLVLGRMGAETLTTTPIDLSQLTATCWESLAPQTATLATESTHMVRADRTRLRQLIRNLLKNAVDHGGPDVSVTVGDLSDGFYVADDGPGISVENPHDVFEAGYTTDKNGTGFGLSIVTQIVDVHDWSITVTESVSGGARFEICDVDINNKSDSSRG